LRRGGDRLSPLTGSSQAYANAHAKALEPWLLAAAMLLLLVDSIIAPGAARLHARQNALAGAAALLLLFVPLSISGARADEA